MLLNTGHLARVLYTLAVAKYITGIGGDSRGLRDGMSTAWKCFNHSVIMEMQELYCNSTWEAYMCDARDSTNLVLNEYGGNATCSGPGLEKGEVVGIKYRICSAHKLGSYWDSICSKSQYSSLEVPVEGYGYVITKVVFWIKVIFMVISFASTLVALALYALFGCGHQDRIKIFINSLVSLTFGYTFAIVSMYTTSENTTCKRLEGLGMYFAFLFLNWTVIQGHFLYSHRENWLQFTFPYRKYCLFAFGTAIIPPVLWLCAVENANGGNCLEVKFSAHIYFVLVHAGCLVIANFYFSLKCDSRTAHLKKILNPSGLVRTLAVLLTQLPFTGLETIFYVLTTTVATSTVLEVFFDTWFAVQGLIFCVRYCFRSEYLKHKVRQYIYQRKIMQGLPPKPRTRVFMTTVSKLIRSNAADDNLFELRTIN